MYVQLVDGIPTRERPRPKWRKGDTPETGRELTDAELAEHGIVPRVDEAPSFNPITQHLVRRPIAEWDVVPGEEYPTVQVTYDVLDRALEDAKARAEQATDVERNALFESGFEFDGHRYQTRPEDRENIAGATQLATLATMAGAQPQDVYWHGGAEPFVWIREDNGLTVMDAPTMIAFGQSAAAHQHALIFAARARKDAIRDANTLAEVQTAMATPLTAGPAGGA